MIASSILSPPTRRCTNRRCRPAAAPATSVVPPPISTTIEPSWLADQKIGADRGRHRFLDQEDAAGAGRKRRFLNGAAFHRRGAGRHAHDDHGIGEGAAVMHLADEMLDHLLGDFRNRRSHRRASDGWLRWVPGVRFQHHLGVVADGADATSCRRRGGDGGHFRWFC